MVDEGEDYIEINGQRLHKPIVEKPISGEDHDIRIYYPRSAGGGSKRLFRKVGDRSSQFYPQDHETRATDGKSYIYEELLQTEGTDVKVQDGYIYMPICMYVYVYVYIHTHIYIYISL